MRFSQHTHVHEHTNTSATYAGAQVPGVTPSKTLFFFFFVFLFLDYKCFFQGCYESKLCCHGYNTAWLFKIINRSRRVVDELDARQALREQTCFSSSRPSPIRSVFLSFYCVFCNLVVPVDPPDVNSLIIGSDSHLQPETSSLPTHPENRIRRNLSPAWFRFVCECERQICEV